MVSNLTPLSNPQIRYGRNISPVSNFRFSANILTTNQILLEFHLEPPYSSNTQGGAIALRRTKRALMGTAALHYGYVIETVTPP